LAAGNHRLEAPVEDFDVETQLLTDKVLVLIEDFLFDRCHLCDDGSVAFEVEVGKALTPLILVSV
jgi:hypothetical protein